MSTSVSARANILAHFRAVATERVGRIEAGWLDLVDPARRPPADLATRVRRELHTLKGDARLAGVREVDLLCHALEDVLALAEARGFAVTESIEAMMIMGLRFLAMLVLNAGGAIAGVDLPGFIEQLEAVLTEERSSEAPARRAEAATGPRATAPARDVLAEATRERLGATALSVFVEHLNAQGPSRERLHVAWRELRDLVAAVSAVPLAPRLGRHVHAAKELARGLGKPARVELACGDQTVRPEVAEALDVAALHLLRNAIEHGLEPADERRRANKSPTATIRLGVFDRGGVTEITVSDDGGGIDWERVRQTARDRGLLPADAAERAAEADLAALLFIPGFSTAQAVTDLSGRGVGLDAVRAALAEHGGAVELRAGRGRGTTAAVRVPRFSTRVPVHTFRPPGAPVPFAVLATWTPSREGSVPETPAVDVLAALGLRRDRRGEEAEGHGHVRFERGASRVDVVATGRVEAASTAERICPTAPEDLAEVIRIDGVEGVLVRPECLLPRRS